MKKKNTNLEHLIYFLKEKICSLEPLKSKKNFFFKIEVDNFIIKIAEKKSELKKLKLLGIQFFTKKKKLNQQYLEKS